MPLHRPVSGLALADGPWGQGRHSRATQATGGVPEKGLEPSHLAAQEPKSCVYTSSTTPAQRRVYGGRGQQPGPFPVTGQAGSLVRGGAADHRPGGELDVAGAPLIGWVRGGSGGQAELALQTVDVP